MAPGRGTLGQGSREHGVAPAALENEERGSKTTKESDALAQA